MFGLIVNKRGLALLLAAAGGLLLLAAAAACGGDSGPEAPEGTPGAAVTPTLTPGVGRSPIQALGGLINLRGLEGYRLNLDEMAECPIEDVIETPGVSARVSLGQFCLTVKNVNLETGGTIVIELPETGEVWEATLTVEDGIWRVTDIEKVSE